MTCFRLQIVICSFMQTISVSCTRTVMSKKLSKHSIIVFQMRVTGLLITNSAFILGQIRLKEFCFIQKRKLSKENSIGMVDMVTYIKILQHSYSSWLRTRQRFIAGINDFEYYQQITIRHIFL